MRLTFIAIGSLAFYPSHVRPRPDPCRDAEDIQSTCYNAQSACQPINEAQKLRCRLNYPLSKHPFENGQLKHRSAAYPSVPTVPGSSPPNCSASAITQHLSQPPYENYFYSDCHVSAQVVVTSPLPTSNLSLIGPRLLVAWPAGNSGVCAFFAPQNGVNGSLSIGILNNTHNTTGADLSPVYKPAKAYGDSPSVGVSGILSLNSSASLTIAILGSVRTIRDFTEGPSTLQPAIQNATTVEKLESGAVLRRLWLDNVTVSELGFIPLDPSNGTALTINNKTLQFAAGKYVFFSNINYPQLEHFNESTVLNPQSERLITQQPDLTKSLTFLSYKEKLLAGAWRFPTYFGRDSMIAALLLQPILSSGEGSAMEAVIGAVLERLNRTDGSVCHEEVIGDYATFLNQQKGIFSSSIALVYSMIDTDYYLPVLVNQYTTLDTDGANRVKALFMTEAGTINPANQNLTWGDLAEINAENIIARAAPFGAEGNQTIENLMHLKQGQTVGEWRDSDYGIGGGRIPYDVNTALVPAALHAIAALSRAGLFSAHPDWAEKAETLARVWEENTLPFFRVPVPQSEAASRLQTYVQRSAFAGPTHADSIDSDVVFHALALDGYNDLDQVQVMNSDDGFRLFLLNTTDDASLTAFLNQTANNVRRTFPAGLLTSVGMLVANPAYGAEAAYARNWTTGAYHGTVVWSWQQALMAKGLERQLDRCTGAPPPAFCADEGVRGNVVAAYDALWDVIEANSEHLASEVWSWTYDDGFQFADITALPAPSGASPVGKVTFIEGGSAAQLMIIQNLIYGSCGHSHS